MDVHMNRLFLPETAFSVTCVRREEISLINRTGEKHILSKRRYSCHNWV